MISNRRSFLQAGLASVAGFAAFAPRHSWAVAPSDKVRVGFIGCGGMGSRHLEALAKNPNCTVAAVCDVYVPRYRRAREIISNATGATPDGFQDFRMLLSRDDIDAIFVATPDHWHPLLAILGCEAGKDVYVEKPVCTTIEEGRHMVDTARRYGRVVQAGTQQRSMPVFQKAIEIVHSGRIGQVTTAGAWIGANGWGVGESPAPIPTGLDWDLWLGPAPKVPFSPQRFGGFMGWHDYARGGQLTNWGIHLMDIVHWGIRKDRPLNIQAVGGQYRGNTGGENYETIEAIMEYEGCTVTWEQRHNSLHGNRDYGIQFNGTDGIVRVNRISYEVIDKSGQTEWVGPPELSWANDDHHNNFFDCVRHRKKPAADIEQGFRSTACVLLAGIALKTRRKLNWDGEAEKFIGDDAANRYLTRPYRAPWHL
ncbi:MAG: dehydrogenase [Candidatus Hydrogenedentota bacterium]